MTVLQFDKASITTVGIVIGLMFLFASVQQFVFAGLTEGAARWIAVFFGVLLLVAGVISLANPENTFAGFADILGFLFLIIATMWIVGAFMARDTDELWWLTLIAGILMGSSPSGPRASSSSTRRTSCWCSPASGPS